MADFANETSIYAIYEAAIPAHTECLYFSEEIFR